MENSRMKKYLPVLGVVISIFIVASFLLIIFKVSFEINSNNHKAITLVNKGRLEIERDFKETGYYSNPIESSIELAILGYEGEFKLNENNTYTYGVNLSGTRFILGDFFWDPMYCINSEGVTDIFENWDCELGFKKSPLL